MKDMTSKKDERVRTYLPPVRIVWKAGSVNNDDTLVHAGDIQPSMWSDVPPCRLEHRAAAASLLIDFGKELHGGIRIVGGVNEPRTAKLRIRFGESVSEAMGAPDQDHAIHDAVVEVPWGGMTEFGTTGFRFIRIDTVDEGSIVLLRGIFAVSIMRDLSYAGSFECSDERINRIWRTGAYTVHLCMQDYIYDGIKRDRLVWLGDLHPELRAALTVFHDDSVLRESLDYVRDQTPVPRYMNGMSSYSLWWIICHYDLYRYRGDRAYLEQQRSYLSALLRHSLQYAPDDGKECLPNGRFFDWESYGDAQANHAGLQAIFMRALAEGASLCRELSENILAGEVLRALSRLRGYAPPPVKSKAVNALHLLAGGAECARGISRLDADPYHGLSAFTGYYVLEALARLGKHDVAMDIISRYWGGMLDAGATSFWEHFEIDWLTNASRIDEMPTPGTIDIHSTYGKECYKGLRLSLCHGWAAGPTAWLTEHVLGISPVSAGFRSVRICPHLGALSFARGSIPTPLGVLSVDVGRGRNGKVKVRVDSPKGMKCHVVLDGKK